MGFGQKAAVRDTARSFLPTGLRVGLDLIPYVRVPLGSRYEGFEVNADVDFYRYFLAVDFGRSAFRDSLRNGFYANEGMFWRVGADVNFLLKDPDRNMIFLGVRYAEATFANEAVITTTSQTFGQITQTFTENNGAANWRELTGGLRVKVWKWLWMGYTFRFKFGLNVQGNDTLQPYDIPGFGLTFRNTAWGANYQVFIKIPFRRQPAPPGFLNR